MAETLMSNGMRRLLAHLAVPRTQEGLADRLRDDPYVGLQAVEQDLGDALDQGWVVKLGQGDPEDVVKLVADDDDAIDFGRGQAKIWQARAEVGRYRHLDGDFYILSAAGHEALQGTDEDVTEEEGE